MSTNYTPWPVPPGPIERFARRLLLVLLGLAIGAVAGAVFAYWVGWIGPWRIVC